MKIAIAADGNKISQHFGHCQGFYVAEVEEGEIKNEGFIQNPGHKPGFLPKYLGEKGINTIITGGMGHMAQTLFNENSIDVITGATGDIHDVLSIFIKGELKSSDEVCSEHAHQGECGEH